MTRARLFGLLLLLGPWFALVRHAVAHEPNDCVLQAARAQAELPRQSWSRLLVVGYPGTATEHCYLVYEWPAGHLWAYDAVHGSRLIHPADRTARAMTAAADPRALTGAYVEDQPR